MGKLRQPESRGEGEIPQLTDKEKNRIHLLMCKIRRNSPIKSDGGKQALAETLAFALVYKSMLERLAGEGKLMSEQARTIPALLGQIGKLAKQLRVDIPDEEDEL